MVDVESGAELQPAGSLGVLAATAPAPAVSQLDVDDDAAAPAVSSEVAPSLDPDPDRRR